MKKLAALILLMSLACGGSVAEAPSEPEPAPARSNDDDDGDEASDDDDDDDGPSGKRRRRKRRGNRGGGDGGDGEEEKGSQDDTLVVDLLFEDKERRYRVVRPPGYDESGDKAYPLIVAYHGGGTGNTGVNMEVNWADDRNHEVILVFPDAEIGLWNVKGNGGTGPDVDPLRDVRFGAAVVADVKKTHRVDASKVYAVGFSNGSALVWEIACSTPEDFAGFAAISLGMAAGTAKACAPSVVRPTLYMHGNTDKLFGGAVLAEWYAPGGVTITGAAETLETATKAFGCGEPTVEQLPDKVDDGTTVTLSTYTCRDGQPFRFYEIANGGHVWPGKTPRRDRGDKNRSTKDISANQEILTFFGLE